MMKSTHLETRPYVYILAYPDGRVFYVGKGVGSRIFEHEREAREGKQSEKCRIIRSIWAKGKEVPKTKLAIFETDLEAVRYESHLISSLGGLANIAQGRKKIGEILLTSDDMRYFGYSIQRRREDGSEYYDAREAGEFFGYATWEAFQRVIKRVIKRYKIEIGVSPDIIPVYTTAHIGRHHMTKRLISSYHLSRDVFLLITIAIDSTNIVASIGKSYIARRAIEAHTQRRENPPGTEYREALNSRLKDPLPSRSIQELQRDEQKRIEAERQPSLFDGPDAGERQE